MFYQRESQGFLHSVTQCRHHLGPHKDDDTENEDEEGWRRMSQAESAQSPPGLGRVGVQWARAGSGRAHGQAGWDLGVQWYPLQESRGVNNENHSSVLKAWGIEEAKILISGVTESLQMSVTETNAQSPTGSEYVHSFNNIYWGSSICQQTTLLGTVDAAMRQDRRVEEEVTNNLT